VLASWRGAGAVPAASGDYAMLTWDPNDPRRDREPCEPADHPKRDEPWNGPDESPLVEPPRAARPPFQLRWREANG